jgi:single-strand DNA-binding protein
MNIGTLAGNIGRDASTKTVGDTTVTNFSLAVNIGFGEKKSVLWVGCALWGARGQKLEQYLTSGTKVAVSGDIDVRAYAAKDGTPKAELTCNVQRITLQGGGERREQDAPQTLAEKSKGKAPADDFDDELPNF